jgi:transcriptional regulator with XRE-family HTH domain
MTEKEFLGMLGKRLRTLRQKANMTQSELAARTGLDQSNISSFENGKEGIKGFTRIRNLVTATGHTMADLFAVEDTEHAPEKKTTKSVSRSKGTLRISLA